MNEWEYEQRKERKRDKKERIRTKIKKEWFGELRINELLRITKNGRKK